MPRRLPPSLRVALAALLAAACGRDEPPGPVAPEAEFIVAAADSVYWVRSEADGIRVRGAPMTLVQVGGRFAELYVVDEDRSFYDAVYVGQRLFKRDLITGDSVALFADTLMAALARGYAAANPDERPLAPDEEGNENPRTIATAEVLLLDAHGPWLSYEYRTDIDVIGGASAHGSRRGVLDLRTGAATSLDALFGAREARRVADLGRAQWQGMRDSLLAATDGRTDSAAVEARDEVGRFGFDPASFTLDTDDRAPRVRFAIVQSAARNAGGSYVLDGIAVPEPAWWAPVREGFPVEEAPDEPVWPRDRFTLVGRHGRAASARMDLALRDAAGVEWRLGSVPAPVLRVMWLEDSLVAPGTRAALTRAFNEAAFYSGDVRIVRHVPPAARGPVRVIPAAHSARKVLPARRHPSTRRP